MKKILLAGSLLFILLIVVSTGFVLNQLKDLNHSSAESIEQPSYQYQSQTADIGKSVSHSMTLDLSVRKTYPEKILVYKTAEPNISRNRLDEYAKKFNVSGTFRNGENAMSLQTEDLVYGVEIGKASGNVIYNVAHRPNDALDSPDKLPSDEESVKIATQFLKEKDLFPEGVVFRKTEREYTIFSDKNGNDIPRNGAIVVWFGRTLNNLDVKGTQLDVEICGNGDVTEYFASWREYTPTKEYPIKTPETAFEELKQEGIRTSVVNPTISINEVTLAYRTKAGAYKEEYLEPIWVFSGTTSTDNAPSESVSKYIPALTDDAVKSLASS